MKRIGTGFMGVAGATAAALTFALAAAPPAAQADAPKTAADCRAISDFELRGKCWDALDQTAQKNAEDAQEAKKKGFGLGLHYPSIAAVLPKREELRAHEAQVRREEIRQQTLTIAEADQTPLGRLLLTSTDGAIWEQTDGDRVDNIPEPGDTVEVSKGMLGGYMCQVTRWQAVRCQRDK